MRVHLDCQAQLFVVFGIFLKAHPAADCFPALAQACGTAAWALRVAKYCSAGYNAKINRSEHLKQFFKRCQPIGCRRVLAAWVSTAHWFKAGVRVGQHIFLAGFHARVKTGVDQSVISGHALYLGKDWSLTPNHRRVGCRAAIKLRCEKIGTLACFRSIRTALKPVVMPLTITALAPLATAIS